MRIDHTAFGEITIDGKTYDHDVIVRLSGEIMKRSKDEAKFVFEKGCRQLILGSGQYGNVRLSPEAEAFFAKKKCEVVSGNSCF